MWRRPQPWRVPSQASWGQQLINLSVSGAALNRPSGREAGAQGQSRRDMESLGVQPRSRTLILHQCKNKCSVEEERENLRAKIILRAIH